MLATRKRSYNGNLMSKGLFADCCRQVLNGRRCFKQEPDVDYDVDSDEDWQEEPEDGESLSVCILCHHDCVDA